MVGPNSLTAWRCLEDTISANREGERTREPN